MKTYTVKVKSARNHRVSFIKDTLPQLSGSVWEDDWWEDSLMHGMYCMYSKVIIEPTEFKFLNIDTYSIISQGILYPKTYKLVDNGEVIFSSYDLEDVQNMQTIVYPYTLLEVEDADWEETLTTSPPRVMQIVYGIAGVIWLLGTVGIIFIVLGV